MKISRIKTNKLRRGELVRNYKLEEAIEKFDHYSICHTTFPDGYKYLWGGTLEEELTIYRKLFRFRGHTNYIASYPLATYYQGTTIEGKRVVGRTIKNWPKLFESLLPILLNSDLPKEIKTLLRNYQPKITTLPKVSELNSNQ